MSNTDIQLRGNCQACGRQHAYLRGTTAKHGYEVKDGYFQGTCPGHVFAPMQLDRTKTDGYCKDMRTKADQYRQRAALAKVGEIDPPAIKSTIPGRPDTPFREAGEYAQIEARRTFVYQLNRMGEILDSSANNLQELADRVHGQPLIEAKRDTAPDPIEIGEKRKGSLFTLVCTDIRGARVYWKSIPAVPDGKVSRGWTGSSAWRRYEKV